jgi:RHS repeat-associated protein
VALTVDEALDAGATQVRFNQSVPFYVENFLGFPAGISVPLGYYNPFDGNWTASDSGRVMSLLSVSGGIAELDVEGSGLPADSNTLASLGISVAERQQLAELYPPGQSLWRVLIPHFSSWDLNWGVSPPPNAVAAFVQEYLPWLVEEPCLTVGSQIECQTQILGESIPIAGTPYSLNYRSDRVEGAKFANTVTLKVSDATVPESLKRIDVELTAGGKRLYRSFDPLPDQIASFTWDGLDVYGRKLQGKVPATVKVGYVYDGVYTATERFGYQGNGELITDGQSRTELVFWSSRQTSFGTWQPLPEGLGGWTLGPHHRFDVIGRTLHYGDGRRRQGADVALIADTVTRMGTETTGDPHEIEAGPDGSLYVPDGNGQLRKISPEGEYSTIATGLGGANDVALAADGTLYVSDSWTHRVWKVQPGGRVEPAAGNGTLGYSGDGGPAVEAQLASPKGITVARDGTLYIAESNNHVVRRVTSDGIISTLAGTGTFGDSGDGGPATLALLRNPSDVALRSDGSVLVTDSSAGKVRQISADGLITTVAGNGLSSGEFEEGIPAVQARLFSPGGIAVDREGNLLITEHSYYHGNVVRIIDNAGIIRHFAGKLSSVGNIAEDRLPALQTLLPTCKGLEVGPDGTVLVAVSGRIRSVYPALPGFTSNQLMIASEDGSELYQFDPSGRHLRTLNALTGGVLHEFIYDTAGVLTTVIDGDGNQTAIERDGTGSPTAIVAPFGQRTNLTVDSNGYLASVANPAAGRVTMAYTPGGLLQTFTDARSHTSSFQFDSLGRLVKDTDAASGYQALFRTEWNRGIEVLRSTALKRVTSYRVEELDSGDQRQLLTFPDGAQNESVKANDATRSYNFANGTRAGMTLGPDPRFGMLVPVVNSLTLTTPSGLASTVTVERVSDLADPDDPLSLVTQTEIETINGRIFTRAFDSARLEFTRTSAEGRETRSYVDSQGRVVEKHIPGLLPVRFKRDSSGRLVEIAQGIGDEERCTTLSYNTEGFVESATDPVGRTIGFEYDPVGRITSQTMADGRSINFSLDPNGNTITVSPPGRPEHIFSYNQVDLEDQYGPPPIGSDFNATSYAYNLDRQLNQVRRLDGQTVDYKYNEAGQLTEIVLPRGTIQAAYGESTGQLISLTSSQGGTLQLIYDGHLPIRESWIGEVSGTVARTYDSNFRLVSESVNGAHTANFVYDKDGLLTKLGDLTISRDPQNGLCLRSTLGPVDETWSYNGFGEPIEHRITVSGSVVYDVHFARDRLGRISSRTETLEGVTETHAYTYDVSGRLQEVHRNDSTVSSYKYDSNNNRVAGTTVGETISAQYDVQDRMLDYRGSAYSYTEEGELLEKTAAGQTTSYDYDVLGNLRAVDLADGTRIEYLIDARNRRIGKKVNGILVQGFLYGDQLHPVAELDGSGSLVARFFYTNRLNSPDYMVKNQTSYRIISDSLGSPRLVIDITTGVIAQRIDYDEFGNVLLDTNPGFQPFGFAGGLYEGDTALVRFGARDYDPEVGRWTAKDPIRFAGGDSNLYGYVLNDPINRVDPFGRFGDGFARGGSYWGHSDFYGSDRFDYVKEDYGWSQPFNPFSTWKHFRRIDDVESSLKRAVCRRNKKEFARLMHHGQDYFSHFEKGYRAFHAFPFRGGWPLPGHVIAGHSPDQDQRAWTRANQWTRIWVKRWDNPGLCGCE